MVASCIDNGSKVALVTEGGKHIIDLNHLTDIDLKQLKAAAFKNLYDVHAVRDQLYEFIRRVNGVLDTRTNNAACLSQN